MTNKEFKPGDTVYVVSPLDGISLIELSAAEDVKYPVKSRNDSFTSYGYDVDYLSYTGEEVGLPNLLPATTENYQALVTLYGEDSVPELRLRGSELTKKLLETQKYVMCLVSGISDDAARSNNPPRVFVVSGIFMDYFGLSDGSVADYAVPIDVDGNEITEYEE